MKITKSRLKQIIKEELRTHDKQGYIEDEYEKFAERGWSLNDENALLAYAGLLRNLTGLSPNEHFAELAALYKEYIVPATDVPHTRKAEVEEELGALEAGVRTDNPYQGSKEISSRKELEREISKLRMLKNILDQL